MPTPIKYKVGTTWGKRTVVSRVDSKYVKTLCECGKEQIVEAGSLNKNMSCQSCAHTKHGQCSTRLYWIWAGMRKRCKDKNNKHYGGAGIEVCEAWQNFIIFHKWSNENGYNDNLEIHRKDSIKGYNSKNCVWLTEEEHCKQPRPKQKNNTSGHVGVYLVRRRWRAYSFSDGQKHLGYFNTIDEAIEAQRKVGYGI